MCSYVLCELTEFRSTSYLLELIQITATSDNNDNVQICIL